MTKSEYTSSKSMTALDVGECTNPSLTWIVPVGGVDVRVDTTLNDMGYGSAA